jgi:flagellar hook-length control protein FliK
MKRLLLFAALIAWSGMAGAVVYKWVDAQGKVLYGDRPPDGVHAEVVELLGTHVARTAAPAKTSDSTAQKPANPDDAATKKAVSEDVEQARAKQCADAQDRYKKLIDGRHLYKTGPDGERQYLTSEEIDTQRLSAKQDVDAACNGST